MSATSWALSVAYWLHMLATVTWIGGLVTIAWLVLPVTRKHLTVRDYASYLRELQKRFDPIAWFSLVVLAGTGMLQMGANPNYEGLFSINNTWSGAILVKHLLFLGMTCVSAYLTWGVLPQMRRLALLRARDQVQISDPVNKQPAGDLIEGQQKYSEAEARLIHLEVKLMRLNLVLGVLVLALTAVARAV